MRVAVAGSGGLGCLIAYHVHEDTSHSVIILSRTPQTILTNKGYQVLAVDYDDQTSLDFALKGIDTLVSTVTGSMQMQLIEAAVRAQVRRFAPAEFEGLTSLRAEDAPLDRGRAAARQLLHHYHHRIQSTVFTCGVFYERFQPGGLSVSNIGLKSGFKDEGSYMLDIRNMAAQAPIYDAHGLPTVTVCLTAADDVARFVARALSLQYWPSEMRMFGERLKLTDLIYLVQQLRQRKFSPILLHSAQSLQSELDIALFNGDMRRQTGLCTLIATVEGHYDFQDPNLNTAFQDVEPIAFGTWLAQKWELV